MREVIHLHVGQYGTQVGAACWEVLCQEHCISSNDGKLIKQTQSNEIGNTQVLFEECPTKYTPRAIFVDLESDTIRAVSKKQGQLHHPSNLLFTKDGGGFSTRARYTEGRQILEPVMERARILMEQCDSAEGFIFHQSIAGGTGSGLTSLIQEHISVAFGRKVHTNMILFPSPRLSTEIVAPYNAVLSFYSDHEDLKFVFDNEQLYQLCTRVLGIPEPSYVHINQIIAKVNSYLTLSARFGGSVNVSLRELVTNLVSFRRINYIQTALAPLSSPPQESSLSESAKIDFLLKELQNPDNMMSSCKVGPKGRPVGSSAVFGGVTSPPDVVQAASTLPVTNWWNPSHCKYGFVCRSSGSFPASTSTTSSSVFNFQKHIPDSDESGALFVNHTSIHKTFRTIANQFDKMYMKRAFVHWFVGEGLESGEFTECRETLEMVRKDYMELEPSQSES